MHRIAVPVVLAALLLTGCGSNGSKDSADEPASGSGSSAKAEPTDAAFFEAADTSAINKAAAAAQKAGTAARADAASRRCDKAGSKGYDAWRACWHGLLDPFASSLDSLAAEMNTLAAHDLPSDCVTELSHAGDTFAGFARQVSALLAGIDSEKRAAQVKAMRTYTSTLDRIGSGYTRPFQALTQVCYSPKDLASINASPRASATPAP